MDRWFEGLCLCDSVTLADMRSVSYFEPSVVGSRALSAVNMPTKAPRNRIRPDKQSLVLPGLSSFCHVYARTHTDHRTDRGLIDSHSSDGL